MGHYGTFDLYELFKIPIPDLLSPIASNNGNQEGEGGVVAVWITNRAKIRKVVVEKLFPAWGLELVAHWYWLKVRYLLLEEWQLPNPSVRIMSHINYIFSPRPE
jgi:N6-adenosine-specific RNA methylase IME4